MEKRKKTAKVGKKVPATPASKATKKKVVTKKKVAPVAARTRKPASTRTSAKKTFKKLKLVSGPASAFSLSDFIDRLRFRSSNMWMAASIAGLFIVVGAINYFPKRPMDPPAPSLAQLDTPAPSADSGRFPASAPAVTPAQPVAAAQSAPAQTPAQVPAPAQVPVSSAPAAPAAPVVPGSPVNAPAQAPVSSAPAGNSQPAKQANAQSSAPPQEKEKIDGPLASEFTEVERYSMEEKVAFWSNFVWKDDAEKRALKRLGSGPQITDSAPLIPSKFDCTTFVETVAALSRSRSSKEFFKNLIDIRYQNGQADFSHRNHFPELDWIPNNEKIGVLKDITAALAQSNGLQPKTEGKTIDRGGWLAKQIQSGKVSRSLASVDASWSKPVDAHVNYIETTQFEKILNKIPNGTILNLVRKNDHSKPVLITHQGFIVQEHGTTLLRHASVGGNVRTVVLRDYLRDLSAKSANWPIIGVNLNQLQGA